jgi:pyrimidine deaminase RibD-like protein
MEKAIAAAEKGRLTAPPNPWVGSVIVAKDNKTILGEGYHKKVILFVFLFLFLFYFIAFFSY